MFTRTYQLLLFLALALTLPSTENLIAQELGIHCVNVGQGDCTVIVSPSGKTMMIDAGPPFNASEEHLCDYLVNTLGIVSLDYFVVTHYNQEHIGGIAAVPFQSLSDRNGLLRDTLGSFKIESRRREST